MQQLAVRASPIAALDRPVIVRVAAASVIFGLFMSFVGAFSLDDDPILLRTVWIMAASLLGAALNLVGYQIALAVPWAKQQFWARVAISAALVALPMAVLVWVSLWMFGARPAPISLLIGFLNAFVVSGVFIAVIVGPVMDAAVRRAGAEPLAPSTPGAAGVPSGFVDRLPPRLRGGELWALQSEDHYVRVHTSRGEALLRLRMADALRELAGVEGAQTHRSWWVARAAVKDVKREEGRTALVLPNGKEAAVSRGAAPGLRDAGWF